MVEGLMEVLILESRGVICHLWHGEHPYYGPIDVNDNCGGMRPPQEADDYRYCVGLPPETGPGVMLRYEASGCERGQDG